MTAYESTDKIIFVAETNSYVQIIAGDLDFVDRPELLTTYQYAIEQLVDRIFITKLDSRTVQVRYELAARGYEFCSSSKSKSL